MPVSKERLWLTRNRDKVVLEGDPEAAHLLLGKGKQVPSEYVKKYGLGRAHMTGGPVPEPEPEQEAKVEEEVEPEAKAVEEADNKAVTEAPANKARGAKAKG